MVNNKTLLFVLSFLLISCARTPESPTAIPVVTVYATSAAQPWLAKLYTCANKHSTVLNLTANDPEIYLRVGEPEILVTPAYQIDQEEILVVTNRQSPVQNLTLEEAQALFVGQGDPSMQLWVYSSGEDVQILFDQLVMKGRNVSSSAKLAASPQEMSNLLNANPNTVGILPRHWKAGEAREVYSVGKVPVLAITKAEPEGEVKFLLSCLQSN